MPEKGYRAITVKEAIHQILKEIQELLGEPTLQDALIRVLVYFCENKLKDEDLVARLLQVKQEIAKRREEYAIVLANLRRGRRE